VFKWTGKNNYVTLCEPKFISFGGESVLISAVVSIVRSHVSCVGTETTACTSTTSFLMARLRDVRRSHCVLLVRGRERLSVGVWKCGGPMEGIIVVNDYILQLNNLAELVDPRLSKCREILTNRHEALQRSRGIELLDMYKRAMASKKDELFLQLPFVRKKTPCHNLLGH
jgi:hypothetical protein